MLENAFLEILNMSFTGSIVILFVLLARLLLKKAPKIFSYVLWSVVLFRLICPFSFESVFSLLPTKASPFAQNMVYSQTPKADDTGVVIINNAVNEIPPAAIPAASTNPLQIWVLIGSLIWMVGVIFLLSYALVTLLQLKKRLKTATSFQDNIFLSDKIDTAFVFGVLRPRIYLPDSLTDGQREHILLHEQIHIKRFDHLIKLLSFFVLCLHWFNPLAWIAFFASSKDMEMSCDEAVVRKLGSDIKKDYSTSLLVLATDRRVIGSTPLAFGEGDTKERIKNVLRYKKPAFWVVAVAIVGVLCVIMALMSNPKDTPADSTRATVSNIQLQPGGADMLWDLPPMIMINSQLYLDSGKEGPLGAATSIDGTIKTTVDGQKKPSEHEQSNFGLVGSAYVIGDGFVQVNMDDKWFIFEPEQQEAPLVEYAIARLVKNGMLSWGTATNEQLAQDIIMDVLVKSAAWDGVDIATLEDYYLIRQTFPESNEVHDYYAYRLPDGTAVLQAGTKGRYSILSEELYESLAKDVMYPNTNNNAQ